MEEAKEALKKTIKVVAKSLSTIAIPLIAIMLIIIIILAASTYFLTVDDGTYKENDWSSVPYGAGQYVGGTTVNEDGTISSNMTADELWEKLKKNKSRVVEYLDGPEELARLMRAEVVTQFPDTRKNPDDPIDWEKIIQNPDEMQGIIKFKRAKTDGNTETMTYMDPDTFQSYIESYNKSGDESIKQEILTHFTIEQGEGGGIDDEDSMGIIQGTGVFPKYNLSPSQLKAIANLCQQEQGSPKGAAAEASLMANRFELVGKKYGTGANGLYNYVRNSRWFARAAHFMDSGHSSNATVQAVKAVLVNGKRTLPKYVDEHDCFSDISSARNHGSSISVSSRSSYKQYVTKIHNKYSGKYTFFCFPTKSSDPFGYTNAGLRQKYGDAYYDFDTGKLINGKEETTQDGEENNNENKDENSDENQNNGENNNQEDDANNEQNNNSKTKGQEIVEYARKWLGHPYVWGGTSLEHGCDCSGFVGQVLAHFGYVSKSKANSHAYTSSTFRTMGKKVNSLSQAAAGDIVCYSGHVAIYDGKGMIVEAKGRKYGITHDRKAAHAKILAIRRFTNDADGSGSDASYDSNSGEAGGNSSKFVAKVATWEQVDTNVTSNDSSAETKNETQYTMSATTVDYQQLVQQYTMPFDLLWELLVVGEDKNFVFELADLVYGSDIQITVHDNLTVDTNIDEKHYTEREKAIVNGSITATCNGRSASGNISNDVHDPYSENNYTTTTKVVTQTNTVDVALTRANTWIVEYENPYTYVKPKTTTSNSSSSEPDTSYGSSPSSTGNSFSCEHVEAKKAELSAQVVQERPVEEGQEAGSAGSYPVTFSENLKVDYYKRYVNIKHDITNIVKTQQYTAGTPTLKEKTDETTEPNFVTIFNKGEYRLNRSRTKDASSWLFEIIEKNNSTKNMLNLIKYLLYKAGAGNYGVTSYDFSVFFPGQLTNASADDYIVHTQKSSSDIVIKDVETLKKAFKGYSKSEKLVEHAQEFLDLQEQYNVNAVFAAAVAIDETSAGRAGNATNGKNNWYNIKGDGSYRSYSSPKESIEDFYKLISTGKYYFTKAKFTVHDIGMVYCENADKPGGWIENVNNFMAQMFKAAGINSSSSGAVESSGAVGGAKDLLAKLEEYSQIAQKEAPRWHYTNSGGLKNTFEQAHKTTRHTNCALFVNWGLIDIGAMKPGMRFYISGSNPTYRNGAKNELQKHATITRVNKKASTMINTGELKPGDICLWSSIKHTNVYAGNRKWYDAGRYSANRARGYTHDNHNFKTFGPISTGVASHNVTYIIRLK